MTAKRILISIIIISAFRLVKCENSDEVNCDEGLSSHSEKLFCQKIHKDENNIDRPELFQIWKRFSVFSMRNISTVTPKCNLAVENLIEGIKNYNLDDLKIFDATGKLPSGLLRGNVNQFGDFDECLSVKQAKYCLVEIDLEPNWKSKHAQFKELIHSHYIIKETFDDVKHRVPGFSMVRWGFCIPKDCTSSDLENALSEKFGLTSRIQPNMCQISQVDSIAELSSGDYIARTIFLILIFVTLIGTITSNRQQKVNTEKNKFQKIIACFDLSANWNSLTTIKDSQEEIYIVHGVRAISAFALLISHKTMALFYNPYVNRSVMTTNLGMRWSVIGRTAILYTDAFMLISGFLNGNSLFKELEKRNSMKFGEKLLTRIFRITPNIVAVILFCTYILPNLNSGPLWPLVVGHHSNLCKQNMWRNIFYVHNYFPFQDMCLTHTHQVGIDMQLFLVTPLVIYVLWISKKIGLYLIGFITVASTILRFVVTWNNNLSHVVHFGIPIRRMFDTANMSYILPTHRATIYFMGVYLAYILKSRVEIKFSKLQATLLWFIFLSFGFISWLGPMHMSHQYYVYNKIDAALYGSLSPILFGSAVAWTIYATEKGYGGFFGDFLSWSKYRYFTKIAYAVYLVQFPVFFYNVGKTKHVDEFSSFLMMEIPETLAIILISTCLTLCVEIPFQKLKTVMFDEQKVHYKIHQKDKLDENQNKSSKKG